MTSTVESISARGVYNLQSTGEKPAAPFSNALQISAATELLKSTGQFEKWQVLSQKNDAEAVMLSDMVLERHDLLEQARSGADIDWDRFDRLTGSLAQKGIFLHSGSRMKTMVRLPEPGAGSIPPVRETAFEKNDTNADAVSGPHPVSNTPAVSASTPPSLSDMDEMVLEMRCDRLILSPALMAYGNETQIFLPLVQTSRILSFNLSAEEGTGRVRGWFMDNNRTLDFDPDTGTGRVEDRSIALPKDRYMVGEDDLYVDSRILSDWFPVDFSYDFSNQWVALDPRETLPFQESMAREAAMKQLNPAQRNEAQLPLKTPEYRLADPLFVDFGLSARHEDPDNGAKRDEGSFYLLGTGDLGFMNSEIHVTGDEDDTVNAARLTLMREDPQAGLLGPLNASKVSIGDIKLSGFPVVGGSKYERGAFVGNLSLNNGGEFDTTYLSGSLAPGWDAQLYRNGVLLDSLRVGEDGRYTFEEVPLYYGANEFTLKFYGPQGQEKEKTERIIVGSDMIQKGRSEYQVSITQKDGKLFEPVGSPDTMDKETARFVGRYRYGLTDNLSLQGGIQSQTIDGEEHDYLNAGVQGAVKETLLSADVVKDLAGGTAVEMLGQKKVGPVNLKVKQQLFDDFTREGETALSNKTTSKTEVSAFGTLPGNKILSDIPFSLSLRHTDRERSEENSVSTRLTAGLKNTHISSYLRWKDNSDLPENNASVDGAVDLTANLGKLRLMGNMAYELHPESRVNQAKISGLYALNRELSSELSVTDNFENDDRVTGSLGLNWNNGNFILSPQVSYSSDGEFAAALSFSTSFGMDGRSGNVDFSAAREASRGAVSARVYEDRNNNTIFDEGDAPISGVEVKADQAYKSAVTDEDGFAFLTGLGKNRQTDISLNRDSLEDPFWEPSVKGNSILPRPGHVESIDIPVMTTGEIDGYLYLEKESGSRKSLNHVPLQLVDGSGEVVQEVKSEYDGFYLFMKVPPGDYEVRLEPEFAQTLGASAFPSDPVAIGNDGAVVAGHDLVFAPLPGKSESRALAAAEPVAAEPAAAEPAVEKSSAVAALPAAGDTTPDQPFRFGLHVSSYRTMESAVRGISYQRDRQDIFGDRVPFTVQKTDLGPDMGTWYRVVAGSSEDMADIKALKNGLEYQAEKLNNRRPWANPMAIEKAGGRTVHTASYQTYDKALAHLNALCRDLGSDMPEQVSVRPVNLGEKGVWYRVELGEFERTEDAAPLVATLEERGEYARVMPLS